MGESYTGQLRSTRAEKLVGEVVVPGDKSISHRVGIFGALADGKTTFSGLSDGADVAATMDVFRALGVTISVADDGSGEIEGAGVDGLREPQSDLDCGNSGTAMRLLLGVLAGQSFPSRLVGDTSLSSRPMARVIAPLEQMGAHIEAADGQRPPIYIKECGELQAIEYEMPVASAQVLSCILLAGLYANGETSVIQPGPCRDHTQRMLQGFGVQINVDGMRSSLRGGQRLKATHVDVPGDFSSAAFFIVAATVIPNSDVMLRNVGSNPSRNGLLSLLTRMGANIVQENVRVTGGETVCDFRVRSSALKAITLDEIDVALSIDEIPILSIAAACADGTTKIEGASELRVKESDRISVMAQGLIALGIEVEELDDGMTIAGGKFSGGVTVDSEGDHRCAMSFAVAGALCDDAVVIRGSDMIATSFPQFCALFNQLGGNLGSE